MEHLIENFCGFMLASSQGHSQILPCSRGEKLGEGLESLLHTSWAGNGGLGQYKPSPPFLGRDVAMIPGPSPNFSPRLQDKIWQWPGDESRFIPYVFIHTTRAWPVRLAYRPDQYNFASTKPADKDRKYVKRYIRQLQSYGGVTVCT